MRLGKKWLVLLVLLLVVGFAGNAWAVRKSEVGKAEYVWKIATLAPKGVGWAVIANNLLIPWVDETSKGEVYIKVYWGGVMGDEKSVIKKMHMGQLQGGGFSGQGATLLCPEFAVMELPFMFQNWEEVDYVKDRMTETMDIYMAKNGIKLLLWNDQDFDQIYSTRYRLDKLSQFKRAKFFTWYGKLEEEVFKALGVVPITVDVPEAPTAVRQGIADSAIAPAIFMVGTQMYSVVKYVNPVKIRYSPAPTVVTLEAWESIPEKFQDLFAVDRYRLVKEYNQEARKDNIKSMNAMIQYGMVKSEMKPEELQRMKDLTRPVWDQLAGDLYPKELLEELKANLADFRSGNLKKSQAETILKK